MSAGSLSMPLEAVTRRRRAGRVALVWVLRLVVAVGPILLWEWASNAGHLAPFIFSRPSRVWEQLVVWWSDGVILGNVGFTLRNAIVGYVLGALAGVVIAVVFVALPRVGAVFAPFMTALNAIPRFAFAPLLVALWGFGVASNLALIVLVILFGNFFTVYTGLQNVDQVHLDWVRVLGAGRMAEWRSVRLPAIVRWVVASLRLSVGLAISAAIVSEFVGGTRGVGVLVSYSANVFQASGVYAGLVLVLILAGCIDTALRAAERRWAHWIGK